MTNSLKMYLENTMNKLTFVTTKKNDWNLVYWNGNCIAEGEVVTAQDLAAALQDTFGIAVESQTKSDDWFEKNDAHMHETLEG